MYMAAKTENQVEFQDEAAKPEGSIRANAPVKTRLNWVFMGLAVLFCFGANLPQM